MAHWGGNTIKKKESFADFIPHVRITQYSHLKNGDFVRAGIWRLNG